MRLAALAAAVALVGCTAGPGTPGRVTVRSVADGDTLTVVDAHGRANRVRLLGIDAPEARRADAPAECGAEAARAALERMTKGRTVTLITDPGTGNTDRYGRALAYLDIDGTDPGLQLVRDGLAAAWYPSGERAPSRSRAYQHAQRTAQASRTGSWATCPSLGR